MKVFLILVTFQGLMKNRSFFVNLWSVCGNEGKSKSEPSIFSAPTEERSCQMRLYVRANIVIGYGFENMSHALWYIKAQALESGRPGSQSTVWSAGDLASPRLSLHICERDQMTLI